LQRFSQEVKIAFSVYEEPVRTKQNPKKELRASEQGTVKNEFSKYLIFNGSAFLIAKFYNIDNIYYIPVNTALVPGGGLSWIGTRVSSSDPVLTTLSCTCLA
jgi:hypothetical protein